MYEIREGVESFSTRSCEYTSDVVRYLAMNYYDSLSRSYRELYGSEQIAKYSVAVRARQGGKILDIGCGIGLLYGFLVKKFRASPELYIGIDISSRSLRKLRSTYGRSGLVEVIAADVGHPPLREKSRFTHIYSFTLYTCRYGDIQAVLSRVDLDFAEEVVLTIMCSDGEPMCPEGFVNVGRLSRIEILCIRVPPGGFEPPTPRSPKDLQPGALPG